jgi:hypothetical protein
MKVDFQPCIGWPRCAVAKGMQMSERVAKPSRMSLIFQRNIVISFSVSSIGAHMCGCDWNRLLAYKIA